MFGAVKSGLRSSIVSRVSRFTYGIGISMPFERGKDPRDKRFSKTATRCGGVATGSVSMPAPGIPCPWARRSRMTYFPPILLPHRCVSPSTPQSTPSHGSSDGPDSTSVGNMTIDVCPAEWGQPFSQRAVPWGIDDLRAGGGDHRARQGHDHRPGTVHRHRLRHRRLRGDAARSSSARRRATRHVRRRSTCSARWVRSPRT